MIRCPYCAKKFDGMKALQEEDIFAAIKLLNTFGPDAVLVGAYIELFGIRPVTLKPKKWRALLTEMKRLFDAETFSYRKKTYGISRAGIVEALNIMVHRNFPDGLDSHNYLKKIMIGISESEYQNKSRDDEKQLRKKEEGLRNYYSIDDVADPTALSDETRKTIEDMKKKLGVT